MVANYRKIKIMKCIIGIWSLLLSSIGLFAQQELLLYPETIPNSNGQLQKESVPTLVLFPAEESKVIGTTIIIFPGGAYSFLAYDEEGKNIAIEFSKRGINACVVKYRLPNSNNMPNKKLGPLQDGQQAIKIIRDSAMKWNIDPNKVGVLGFSAGGHLASTLGTHFIQNHIQNKERTNLRPDFMILVYPLISMEDSLTHSGSKISLLGMEPTETTVKDFSNELQVTKETPPTYLTHCEDDQVVDVKNSIIFYQSLQNQGVYSELHLVPKGNHGFIQRMPTSEWLDPILKFLDKEGFYSNH